MPFYFSMYSLSLQHRIVRSYLTTVIRMRSALNILSTGRELSSSESAWTCLRMNEQSTTRCDPNDE